MPLNYLSNSYGGLGAAQDMGQGMGNFLMGGRSLPMLQMQLRLRQQELANQQMLDQAHAEYYKAQTEAVRQGGLFDAARTQKLNKDLEFARQFQSAVGQSMPDVPGTSLGGVLANPLEAPGPQPNSLRPLAEATAGVMTESPSDIAKQLAQLRMLLGSQQGQASVAVGQHPLVPVGAGGLYDYNQGRVVAPGRQGPETVVLPQGGTLVNRATGDTVATGQSRDTDYTKRFNDLLNLSMFGSPQEQVMAKQVLDSLLGKMAGATTNMLVVPQGTNTTSTGLRYTIEPVK